MNEETVHIGDVFQQTIKIGYRFVVWVSDDSQEWEMLDSFPTWDQAVSFFNGCDCHGFKMITPSPMIVANRANRFPIKIPGEPEVIPGWKKKDFENEGFPI